MHKLERREGEKEVDREGVREGGKAILS